MFKGKKTEYRILGICSSKITNEDIKGSIDSICACAIKCGWKVMLFSSYCDLYEGTEETAGEASIYKLVNMDMLDALIIFSESMLNDEVSHMLIGDAESAGIPVITVEREYEGTPCICLDDTTTFEQIVRHVIEEHGCRTVNFMAGIRNNTFSDKRLECFKKVLAENNIPYDERRVGYGEFWDTPTVKAMDEFMSSGLPLPQAIICCNDSMAISVCRYLAKLDIKVPEDIIVTGFDGIELEKYCQPRLTTAAIDFAGIGAAAMDMVREACGGKPVASAHIPYKLRIAHSCGCMPANTMDPCEKIIKLYDRVSNSAWHEDFMFSYLRNATGCHSLNELAAVMQKYGDYYEWFCINTDIFDERKSEQRFHGYFTDSMNAFMIRDMDKLYGDGAVFPTDELLPNMETVLEKHDVLFFSPLHFMEEVLGYACASMAFAEEFVYTNRRRYIGNTSQLLENLINRVKLERANSELAVMHVHDPLTGLLNRRGFYKQFEAAAAQGAAAYIFSIDMDRLKYINDTFGHNEGDRALRAIAAALLSDTGSIIACSRIGGDEFAVIGIGEDFSPESYIGSVQSYLDRYNRTSGASYSVGVSVGWERADLSENVTIDEVLRTADARMYENKRSRRAQRAD